ncbi:DNA cytosine methyltransferase [Methylocapsa sp. S129]|uniref:DNA cytosine methyltransferase n=1 Tax=Methylocapsa sp. S129 TaxID=1641869 RepID=UPI00131A9A18|nr:DNA cytosine methyltransferase [Methylocapsa sp. S129]
MRSVELFAGCGGLALGIARAGFAHDIIVERDSDSVTTLRENKMRQIAHVRDWPIAQCDTRELDFRKLGNIDLLSGGPPCQPFSIGGLHLGPRDPRNMWPEAIRAVREIRPKAFILENVRGLFRPAFAGYLAYITLQLTYPDAKLRDGESWKSHLTRLRQHAESRAGQDAAYRVISRAINAADYGAPQKRHRAIFIGMATQYGDDWSFPAATHSQEALAWSKHVARDYWKRHHVRRMSGPASVSEGQALKRVVARNKKPDEHPWLTVRDAISDLPTPTKTEKVAGHWQHPGARAYDNHTGSHHDEPAKALKAGDHGVPGGENMLADRQNRVRYFTIREMARLQQFPDDFIISGSWKAATRQLGNALPTSVGQHIGGAVMKLVQSKRSG